MRRVLLSLVLLGITLLPVAAQDRLVVPDLTRYAEYAPADTAAFAFIRMDVGYREQTNALLARLKPLLGDAEINDLLSEIFGNEELLTFLGDAIGVTVLTPDTEFDNLFDDDSQVIMNLGIRDLEAAKAFVEETFDEPFVERNGWLIYTMDDEVGVLLRGDIMLVSPQIAVLNQIASGDYGKLSSAPVFTDVVGRLPESNYDFLLYGDLGAIVAAQSTRSDPAMTHAVSGVLGQWAVGGVNVAGRDLLLDVAWQYGDAENMAELGFSPNMLTAAPVDLTFAQHIAPDTQFYLQSTGFGGMLKQLFQGLNIVGGLMEDDASTRYFGLEEFLNENSGDMAKGWVTLGLSALTGLDLEADVLEPLDGDFALYFGVTPTEQSYKFVPSIGIAMREDGQSERFASAIVSSLDRARYPITRVPLRGGEALDLSVVTDPLVVSLFEASDAANDPELDVWFGSAGAVMALGTAPSVQFALEPGTESLATLPAFQHAVSSTFLADAQAIAFIHVTEIVRHPDDGSLLSDLIESAAASVRADQQGVVGRLALTLK